MRMTVWKGKVLLHTNTVLFTLPKEVIILNYIASETKYHAYLTGMLELTGE